MEWINCLYEQLKGYNIQHLVVVVENRCEDLVEADGGTDRRALHTARVSHYKPRAPHPLNLQNVSHNDNNWSLSFEHCNCAWHVYSVKVQEQGSSMVIWLLVQGGGSKQA